MKVDDASRVRTGTRTEEERMLALLRERLDEVLGAGEVVLRLNPEDLRSMGSEAGVEKEVAAVFRSLVRSNLVRLRGRWREGASGVTAPVYVARLTGRERHAGGV